MGDEAGPAEREVASLRFQQLSRLKIFDGEPQTLTPRERLHLVAVSNKHGYTFIGSDFGVKILQTSELLRIHEANKETAGAVVSDYECIRIKLGTMPLHVALNAQDLILSVCYRHGNQLILNLYDVRVATKKGATPAPFMRMLLTDSTEIQLVSVAWNPGFESLVVTCLSDGSLTLWDCSGDMLKPVGRLPPQTGITAVCWSPKGKQMVIGTAEGELKQYTHAMENKKLIKAPDFTQEPVKVVDILWLSTYMFIVAYIDADESLQPNVAVVHAPKEKPVSYINFEDICFGSCEERAAYYYLHYIDKWAFTITCSSNSVEGAVLGRQQENKDLWEIWTLDDAARVEMPLYDHEETMPMGMAVDYTSQMNITIKQHILPPAPILMVLSSEGLLCPFNVINLEDAEGITKKPLPFPTGGERVVSGNVSQAQTAAPQKPSVGFGQPSPAPPQPAPQTIKAPAAIPSQPAFGAGASGGQFSFAGGSGSNAPSASAGFQFKTPAAASAATPAPASTGPPAFGSSQSSMFGSGGFSFNGSGTTAASSASTAKDAGQKTFSFAAAAQNLQSTQSTGFGFKAPASGAAPGGFASASPANAFVTVSKPATTTATTVAAAPSKPVPTQTAEAAKQPKSVAPRGPPNAVAPASGGLGFGAASSLGKGPPNAVAPPSSGLFQQGQPSGHSFGPPNAVAPSSSGIGFGPPNVVAPGAKAAVAPSITKGTTPQPSTPLNQTQSVAPSPRAAGVAPGLPNAVAPSTGQGLPSYKDATTAHGAAVPQAVAKAPVARAVGVTQPTPKAPSRGPDPPGISAASTPAATAKPITDALRSNIREEMELFNKELSELKARAAAGDHSVGSTADLKQICKGVEDLASFKVDVLDCTKSLNEDVHTLKSRLLNAFSLVEESRLRRQRSRDPRYLQLLRSRGLDPQAARQLQEIRSLYRYLDQGIRDANASLDMDWDKLSHGRAGNKTRKMVTPTMDAVYQTLCNHVNVMSTQQNKLVDLRKQLTRAHRYDVPSSFGALPASKIKPISDPSSLATKLAEVRVRSPPKARSTPLSAKKQAILRDVLSQRQTTPIRSAPRAALASSSSVGSTSDLEDFPNPAERLRFPSDESPPSRSVVTKPPPSQAPKPAAASTFVSHGQTSIPPPAYPSSSQMGVRSAPSFTPQGAAFPSASATFRGGAPSAIQGGGGVPAASRPHPSGMVTSTPLPQAKVVAGGGGPVPQGGQVPPPKTSSFAHTGSGTVAWGMTGPNTTKSTSPGQLAGAAALNRVKAGNTPVEKPNPPVVNIKNLDTMKGTMPPPVTFAPVASTVDAGTAKVVTQVIAEMAMASGVKPPQPGTAASASSSTLSSSSSERRSHASFTQAKLPVAMTTASSSAKPFAAVMTATATGKLVAQPSSALSTPSVEAAQSAKPPAFSTKAATTVVVSSTAVTTMAGLSFGSRSAIPSSSFSLGSPASSITSSSSAAGSVASQPPPGASGDQTGSGVKPQIFDFTSATSKPNANSATPGGYFFGAPTSAGATLSAGTTSGPKAQIAPSAHPVSKAPSQPAAAQAPGTSPTLKQVLGTGQVGSVKPPLATQTRAADEAGAGAKQSSGLGVSSQGAMSDKPSMSAGKEKSTAEAGGAGFKPSGSSGLLGSMLDKPVSSLGRAQGAAVTDENAKLQQSTKNILSGVTFPTGSTAPAQTGASSSTGSAARNLFGAPASSSATSSAAATGAATPAFGSSGLFTLSKEGASKAAVASIPSATTAQVSQAAATATTGLFGKPSGSLFGTSQASSAASSGASSTVTTTTASSGFGLFGQPASSTATAKPSLFGQAASSGASTTSSAAPPAFGQSTGLFGQATTTGGVGAFGQSSAGGFSFGGKASLGPGGEGSGGGSVFGAGFGSSSAAAASTTTPVFGNAQTSAPSFGQLANAGSTSTSGAAPFGGGGGASSGGFFSGLGGKPDPEAAKKNPFASAGFGGTPASGGNLFGTTAPKTFGSPQQSAAFGGTAAFGAGSSSGVSSSGFGGFGQPSGFGQASPAGFGTGAGATSPSGGGGGGLGFGTGATFSNPLGGTSPFGSPQQAQPSAVFGGGTAAASSSAGFGNFASSDAPSFGALAGGGGFGQQPQQQQQQQQEQQSTGFGGFGGGANTGSGFGGFASSSGNAFGASNSGSSGFSGGTSFSQYR